MYLLLGSHHLILLLSPPLTSSSTSCICTWLSRLQLLAIDSSSPTTTSWRIAEIVESQVLRRCQSVQDRVVASSTQTLVLVGPR